jgi:hypothetical protein
MNGPPGPQKSETYLSVSFLMPLQNEEQNAIETDRKKKENREKTVIKVK